MTIRRAIPYDLLVSELGDADGRLPCSPPDACDVCALVPRDGEDWPAFLARVRAMWQAAGPQERPAVTPAPLRSLVCEVCGVTFRAVRADAYSKRCRMRKVRARRRAAVGG